MTWIRPKEEVDKITRELQWAEHDNKLRLRHKNAIAMDNTAGGIDRGLNVVDVIWKSIKNEWDARPAATIVIIMLLCLITSYLLWIVSTNAYLIISLAVWSGYSKSLDVVKSFAPTATQ